MEGEEPKDKIREKAFDLGINLVRSCSVYKWEEIPIQDPEFWPQNIWPCGVCANVCPVGEDRKLYRGTKVITEEGIRHCQSFGS